MATIAVTSQGLLSKDTFSDQEHPINLFQYLIITH